MFSDCLSLLLHGYIELRRPIFSLNEDTEFLSVGYGFVWVAIHLPPKALLLRKESSRPI
jgi:hypothetical protein